MIAYIFITIWIGKEVAVFVNFYTNPERSVIIYTICSINRRFYTCLDYVYKDSWKIILQNFEQ